MESNPFKSVAFGGFAKEDVIAYIEQSAREASAAQETLRQENEDLLSQVRSLTAQLEELRASVGEETARREQLETQLREETAARAALAPYQAQTEQLTAEKEQLEATVAALRPDAEAYAQFRERIGAIECEARKRAADLEASTVAHLERITDEFRQGYRGLVTTFDAAAAHVTGELRKVEVNLTQLPRAMDRSGKELETLAAALEQAKKTK